MTPLPTWFTLSISHLVFLAAVCGYVAHFFPGEASLAVIFLLAGMVGEAISWWRRILLSEGLLLATAGAVLVWWHPVTREQWHAFLGLLMAAWLLVPSRLGWLRWLVPLAALEVLYLGINADSPQQAHHASIMLLPIALGALASDAWMMATSGARTSVRSRPPLTAMLRWAAVPALGAVLIGGLGGHLLSRHEKPVVAHTRSGGGVQPFSPRTVGLRNPSIGEPGLVSLDPEVAARLNWQGSPPPQGMVYLREMAFDIAVPDGDKITWNAPDLDERRVVERRVPEIGNACWVFRAASDNDVVLRPDEGLLVDLDALEGDRIGNLYRSGLGEAPRVYRCSLADGPVTAAPDEEAQYVGINSRLREFLPWEEIEAGQPWARMNPDEAAAAIASTIQSRCRYGLDIPTPAHGSGGALRTFLFSPDRERRVGHCQYFATAETLLLRHTGHPARLVTGFASSERDEQGVTFRALHAHAWTEFIDATHHWRRIDATPGSDLLAEQERFVASADLPPVDPQAMTILQSHRADAVEPPLGAPSRGGRSTVLVAVLAAVAIGIGWLLARWRSRRQRDPRRAELERRANDLFDFARSLGLVVGPATTVNAIASALEQRTGLDLTPWRDAHLAARYGTGPIPEPWPYARMKDALHTRERRVPVSAG